MYRPMPCDYNFYEEEIERLYRAFDIELNAEKAFVFWKEFVNRRGWTLNELAFIVDQVIIHEDKMPSLFKISSYWQSEAKVIWEDEGRKEIKVNEDVVKSEDEKKEIKNKFTAAVVSDVTTKQRKKNEQNERPIFSDF